MARASKFDDQEALSIPANQVLAIIMESGDANDMVQTLNRTVRDRGVGCVEDAHQRSAVESNR